MFSCDDLVYRPTADAVARALISSGAYKVLQASEMDEKNFFTWKSGIRAPVYNDCRVLQAHSAEAAIIGRSLVSSIEALFPAVDIIIGMAEAGLYWSAVTASGLSVPHAFVRKHAKSHGVAGMVVPGDEIAGAKAVLVDDLMASGGTIEKAIKQISDECNVEVIGVQTIVNWGFRSMRSRFTQLDVETKALTSYPYILKAAVEAGVLTKIAAVELNAFYLDPKEHEWNMNNLTKENQDKEAC